MFGFLFEVTISCSLRVPDIQVNWDSNEIFTFQQDFAPGEIGSKTSDNGLLLTFVIRDR